MSEHDRKVAIITGGSQGIGAGLVAEYRRRGWAVVATSRTIKPDEDPAVLTVDGDISEAATTDRIISGALERFGRIDTLVNNAGVYISKPFTDYTADDYATVVGVNLTGFFTLTQRAIVEMLKRGDGHIVNITTTLADYANSSAPSVLTSLTKGGLASATKSLAIEYASRGIRVNAVSPGIIQTPVHPAESYAGLGYAAPPGWARGPGPRHRRRHPLPGVVAVHHRRGPAYRRRPDRRPLTVHRRSARRPVGACENLGENQTALGRRASGEGEERPMANHDDERKRMVTIERQGDVALVRMEAGENRFNRTSIDAWHAAA